MPTMINGIGTWYLGKSNRIFQPGICPHCKRQVNLSSYDTRQWLMILHIPLFPFSRLRVVRQCPSCTKHGRIPFDQAKTMEQKAVTDAREKLSLASPDFEQLSNKAVICHELGKFQASEEILSGMGRIFKEDSRLAVLQGTLYKQRRLLPQALEQAERAVRMAPQQAASHYLLGEVMVLMRRKDEAISCMEQAAKLAPRALDVRQSLIELYKGRKDWTNLLRVLEECAAINPSLRQHKPWMKLAKKAGKKTRRSTEINVYRTQ